MKKNKPRRKRHKIPRIPRKIENYFCTAPSCMRDHYRGLTPKRKFARHYILYRQKEAKLAPKTSSLPKELPAVSFTGKTIHLHPEKRSEKIEKVIRFLKHRVVGQDDAVESFANLVAKIDADICDPYKPRGIYLLLGPTGVGKTRIAEALAEYYFSSRTKMVKFNCGEMATMFSFRKFGDRLFTDENISLSTNTGKPLGILLLDEIEKATVLLYKLLMGILDRASLRIDDQDVDLSHTVVIMTSNLGSEDIMNILKEAKGKLAPDVQKKMRRASIEAARQKFTPEFFNRLDEVQVFNPLLHDTLQKITQMEISNVEQRLIAHDIRIQCTDLATDMLLKEGTDVRYGARHLRRTIEKMIVQPIAHMIASGELEQHSRVRIIAKSSGLAFRKVVDGK
jgi:ATP-dependent Clp protease ATP-binding subunit ClpB